MQKQRLLIVLIMVLVLGAIAILTQIPPRLGLDLKGGSQLTIQAKPTADAQVIDAGDLESLKSVLENRIDKLGTAEPIIQTVGQDKILVQLPGVNDPAEAERVLGGTAKLEFRKQKPGTDGQLQVESQIKSQKQLELELLRRSPATAERDQEIGKLIESIRKSDQAILELFEPVGLTGSNLTDARPQPLPTGNFWEVAIAFDEAGGDKFAQLTKELAGTGRTLGIFLDEVLLSAPRVGPEFAATGIAGGRAVVTGNFTIESANELAVQIKGGALPFPVEVVENRTVGATLGQDSIRRSIYAGLGGLVLVLIFMVVYYRVPGVIADISLLIYTILTLAAFSLANVTLTLPGIAGFILSIGMAVDANVLIFERTREELRNGKTLYRSVESGFYRAFSSILDGNVTTLIACIALFWLGSGLVKGFALTLAIGVVVSMFTAITCSRALLLIAVLGLPQIRQRPELFCPKLSVSANLK
ncbi:protein translocase subunit SecD [Gloeocapsa sp. PCC 73106]|uniref:protein translocase subunit SecD n=1 Tax=Gloeocapsa sp. PCC 73106 TaxID=102232 RepID=UPI0002AC1D4A|nr:protein translocase subunit SecD [Gloeocapsa sp. PCC 73106]ELR98060.1 protein-export membrane protein, SecD/SecF family [Gloeocapsa sp. PCC 73106]